MKYFTAFLVALFTDLAMLFIDVRLLQTINERMVDLGVMQTVYPLNSFVYFMFFVSICKSGLYRKEPESQDSIEELVATLVVSSVLIRLWWIAALVVYGWVLS